MQDLLLLHGAIGTKEQFDLLALSLKPKFNVHTINFGGHGGSFSGGDFTIENFANDVLTYLSKHNISAINIFGYSMGGYVALYLARHHATKIERIFTFATKFLWSPEIAHREIQTLDANKILEKIPAFARKLESRHGENWKEVLKKTAEMMIQLGNVNPLKPEDFTAISHIVRVGVGDRDAMVTLDETIAVYRSLSAGSLTVFPDTTHPIEKVSIEKLTHEIELFFMQT